MSKGRRRHPGKKSICIYLGGVRDNSQRPTRNVKSASRDTQEDIRAMAFRMMYPSHYYYDASAPTYIPSPAVDISSTAAYPIGHAPPPNAMQPHPPPPHPLPYLPQMFPQTTPHGAPHLGVGISPGSPKGNATTEMGS